MQYLTQKYISSSDCVAPDRCFHLDVVIRLAYHDEAIELYWMEQLCQTGRLKSGKTESCKPKTRGRNHTSDCTEV